MKFNINNYKGKYVMHCNTEGEAIDFADYMASIGSPIRQSSWCYCGENVSFFNEGTWSSKKYAKKEGYTILEWSDYMKRKNFTKADFESGMVVECRNGERYLVLKDKLLNNSNHWHSCGDYTSELKEYENGVHQNDIMKIYDTIGVTNLHNIFDDENLIIIWERQEIKEMTVAEIEKELGYNIKIVK